MKKESEALKLARNAFKDFLENIQTPQGIKYLSEAMLQAEDAFNEPSSEYERQTSEKLVATYVKKIEEHIETVSQNVPAFHMDDLERLRSIVDELRCYSIPISPDVFRSFDTLCSDKTIHEIKKSSPRDIELFVKRLIRGENSD